jgi:hypothetical protein
LHYGFDLVTETWVKWADFRFDDKEYVELLTDFGSNMIIAQELIRLNPNCK